MTTKPHRHVPLRSGLRASLIVFIAAWPTILVLQATLAPLVGGIAPVAQAAVLCAVMAPLLTFFLCPWLDGLLPGAEPKA